MQLSNIALATILITMFATGPVTSTSVSEAIAKFKKLETEAAKESRPGPKEKQLPTGPKPRESTTAPITKLPKPAAGSYPPSSEGAKGTGKPAQPPTKEPTVTSSQSKPPPQPRVPPAPKPAAPPQPATKPLKFLFPPTGPPTMPPGQFEKQQESQRSTAQAQKVPGASSVAELAGIWGERVVPSSQPAPRTSYASPPKPTSRTPSKPSGAPPPPPKVTSIPEDTNFTRFKKEIEQGKYSDAMKIVHKLPDGKSREPYGRHLASLEVPKILKMVEGSKKTVTYQTEEGETMTTVVSDDSPLATLATLGLFLMHADDAKFGELLQQARLKPEIQDEALLFSIEHNTSLSPEGFTRVFKALTRMPSRALEAVAKSIFRYGGFKYFPGLIAELEKRTILDKDLVNFAYNAAFVEACRSNIPFLAEEYYGQAKILSSMYAKAIIAFCAKGPRRWELFDWLLDHAGGDDLLLTMMQGSSNFKQDIKDKIEKRYMEVSHKLRYA